MVPGGGSISAAPRVKATSTCSSDVSKAGEATWATRSCSPIWYSSAIEPMTDARLP